MNPGLEEARAIFDEDYPGRSWNEWLEWFKSPGRVFLDDKRLGLCLMAYPCKSPQLAEKDSWFIWYAAGPIHLLESHFPYPLPYVWWARRKTKRLHFVRWDRISGLVAQKENNIHGRHA